jgi:DNA-binding NarL/FixJ family response regulator
MQHEISVLIADDHPIVRQGLRLAIEADPQLKVVAEASNGKSALAYVEKLRPQVAVIDIEMPDIDGFAVAREVGARRLPVEIVFLTVYGTEGFFTEALRLGAKGYVLKDSAVTDIVSGIRAVAAGEHFTSPALISYLVRRQTRIAPRVAPGLDDLTPAELRVLELVADYKTSREIGEALHVSYRTVQAHRTNICAKLDLRGSHALMKFALEHRTRLSGGGRSA